MKIREICELFLINIKFSLKNIIEHLKIIVNYYPNFQFFKIDSRLLSYYLFNNPFRISKLFLLNKGETDIYTYGETPLTTLSKIARECQFSAQDTVVELGCGRGRTCFWLHQFVHCKVVGIDYVPYFIETANSVKNHFKLKKIDFRLEDFLKADLKGATVIYLYGTCLDRTAIEILIEHFAKLPSGTRIITVSYSLLDYTKKPLFKLEKSFSAPFAWGVGDVYLQARK